MEGLRVGSFTLERPLATGGMGAVWRAVHHSGVAAAVKIIPTDAEHGLFEAVAGLQAEIRTVGALDHPNIVRVYDAGALTAEHEAVSGGAFRAGSPWLAMELLEGPVQELLRGMDWPRLSNILLQALDGLSHAHARGMVHRDLKPANLLFTRTGGFRVLLADFGLAWAWRSASRAMHGGSLPYSAPEQILGLQIEQGPWTDLYGLACTAYRLATGRRPYRGNAEEIRRGHLFGDIPKLTPRFPVPEGFDAWLTGMLTKDPRRRFQRAADAAWALLQLPMPIGAAPEEEDEDDVDTVTIRLGSVSDASATLPVTQWAQLGGGAGAVVGSVDRVRAPLPEDWGRPRDAKPVLLGGRGFGLFGLRDPPMVGRRAERDALWDVLGSLRTPRVVVLRGVAGIGKSRLASWLCERSHEVGASEVFRASFGQMPTENDGLSGLLEEHFKTFGMSGVELLRHLKHTLRAEGVEDPAEPQAIARMMRPGDVELGTERVATQLRHDLVGRILLRRTVARSLVLWIDDVHWSSEAVAFAEHLVRVQTGPTLIVLTVRDDLLPATLGQRIGQLVSSTSGTEIRLGALPAGEVRALVETILPVQGDLAERIEVNAAGSPLVAVQMVADLVQRGQLQGDPGGVWLEPSGELPSSLAMLWSDALDRLAALDPTARLALQAAAVLGTTFAHSEWRDVVVRLGLVLSPALVALLAERGFLLPERGGGRYSFSHAALRDRLLEETRTPGSPIALACAEVIDTRGEAFAARAGAHFEEAGALSRAVGSYLRAMRWLSEWDHDRALEAASRWYGALGKIANDNDPRWSQGMQVLVDLYAVHGGQAHWRAVEELAERGRVTGDRDAELRALIELARLDVRALSLDRAEARAELALRRSKGSPLRPLAVVTRAEVRRLKGDPRGAEAALRDALLDLERGVEQPVILALARVLGDAGRAREALDLLSDWADRQTRAQAPMARARLQRGRGLALLDLNRVSEAVAALDEARMMRDRAGFDWPVLDLDLACAAVASDDEGTARDLLEAVLPRLEASRDARHRAEALVALAELDARIGAFSDLARRLDELMTLPVRGHRHSTVAALSRVAARAERLGETGLTARVVALARRWGGRSLDGGAALE